MTLNIDDAMKDLLAGDEARFHQRLKEVDPMVLRGLYERSRELGRSLFIAAEYSEAIEKFTGALCIAPSTGSDKASLFANRAACYIKLNRAHDALNEARKAIAVDQHFAKGWFRAAQAFEMTCDYAAAKCAYAEAARCAGVDLCQSNSSNEIYRKWQHAEEEVTKSRQKRRYDIDYGRFESVVDALTKQELREAQMSQAADAPSIEFAEGLSEEQKAALKAQLMGEMDAESIGLPFDGSGVSIRMDRASRKHVGQASQQESLLSVFQLQYEARYPDRLFGLLDSGLAQRMTGALVTYLKALPSNRDLEPIVFIGYGSLLPTLQSLQVLLAGRLRMPAVHLVSRGVSRVASETLIRVWQQNKISAQQHVHFHRDVDCLRGGDRCHVSESGSENEDKQQSEEESYLQKQGLDILQSVSRKGQIPAQPELCVIDLECLDGYLMGPRFPMMHRLQSRWSHSVVFPARISLKARLVQTPDSEWSSHASFETYLKWSLLPVPVSDAFLQECRLSYAYEVNSFPFSETRHDVDQFAYFDEGEDLEEPLDHSVHWGSDARVDAVLLYVTIADDCGGVIFDALRDRGPSHLRPHLLWLHSCGTPEQCTTVRFPVDNRIIMGAELGRMEAPESVLEGVKFKVHASSFRSHITASCDRHNWDAWLNVSPQNLVGSELAHKVQIMKTVPSMPAQSRLRHIQTQGSEYKTQIAEDINVCYFDVGNVTHALDVICSLLTRRLGLDVLAPREREVSLTLMESSQGSTRFIRSLLRSEKCLKAIRKRCWIDPPKQKDEWHRGNETAVVEESHVVQDEDYSLVRDWLFAYETKNGRPRFRLKAGSVQVARCLPENENQDTQMALCRLFGVPPGTPGLEAREGCVEFPPLDLVVMGSPESLPLDCFASGFLTQVVYVKDALLRKGGEILPHAVKYFVQLVRHTSIEGCSLQLDHIGALRGPVAPDQCGETLYTTRSVVSQRHLNNELVVLSDPILFWSLDFDLPVHSLMERIAKSQRVVVPSLPGVEGFCNGLYISTEYLGLPARSQKEGLLQNVVPFAVEPRTTLEFGATSMNGFKLIPVPQNRMPMSQEEMVKRSSPAAAYLSMKEGELVRALGQSLASSKEVVEQVAGACVACSATPCEEAVFDARIVNNLVFAALS